MPARFPAVAVLCASLAATIVLNGCAAASGEPSDSAAPPARPSATSTSESSATASAEAATAAPQPDAWPRFEVGDGHTSWQMPEGWRAEIEQEVVEGRAEWTDYRGLVRDASGTPMLRFEAIASGGQYATDFWPCERPETEVFEWLPLGDGAGGGASVVALAYEDGGDGVVFAAGISRLNPHSDACEPDILGLSQRDDPAGYDVLLLQIVDDEGMAYPRFADFDAARAYVESAEYGAIRAVLASFESR